MVLVVGNVHGAWRCIAGRAVEAASAVWGDVASGVSARWAYWGLVMRLV